ncbi:MAG: amino acid permease [Verrucomicrobia bacterium]|nr:MAG: amino acid permease [Verrucomicrobiota bacterium]
MSFGVSQRAVPETGSQPADPSGVPDNTAAPHLQRVIGVTGLGFASFNSIVGSGIFALPGMVAALMGPSAILAYLVCAVLVTLMGLCFAEVGSRVTESGGVYAYGRVAFGPVVGGIAGTLLWSANSVFAAAAVANFLADTLAVPWPIFEQSAPRMLFLAGLFTLLAVVNIRGTRLGARFSVATAVIKLVPLVVLMVAGAFAIHPQNLHWSGMPPLKLIGQGAVLVFFVFMGVESGLSASGEVANPARTIPRAVALALTLTAALYIGLQLVSQGVLGPDLATAKAPLAAAATAVFGPWGGRLLWAAGVLSATGYFAGDALCSPRIVYALAEAGQLPRKLSAVHPRFGTPAVAIVVYLLTCFLVSVSGSFRQLLIISSSGTLLLYIICCLGLLRLRARNIAMAGEPFRAPGGTLLPLAAAAIMVWMLTTLEWKELAAATGLVLVSAVVYWFIEHKRAEQVNR